MFSRIQIYQKLLNLSVNMLAKSKPLPKENISKLELDISCPIIYVLPYNSVVDLLILRTQSLAHNLPDPLEPLIINGVKLSRYIFIYNRPLKFSFCTLTEESNRLFNNYLDLSRNNLDIDVQIVLVYIMFSRYFKNNENINSSTYLSDVYKFFSMSLFGKDTFIHFSISAPLKKILKKREVNQNLIQKLIRMARMYFTRQHLAMVGPSLLTRQNLFNKLLLLKSIIRAVENEARIKKISYEQAQKNALSLIKEISSNFSYRMIRLTACILRSIWGCLYKNINVYNIERVRKLAYKGYKIVYIPCHRSHMDYLLLSYVLYHQGLALPHIVAGINLNFWPAGPIFRRLGAFFIRRTFKRNKLYSTIFREYMGVLFSQGFSIEYFIEGRRSRTGRLLDPKTGTLSMTIQTILRNSIRRIALIPVNINYERVIEEKIYAKELFGATKKKENFIQMVYGLIKLRNLGQGYINFGEPLLPIDWLNQYVPDWRESINSIDITRPSWLMPTANSIAVSLMIRINNASSVNAINLCCTALLASHHLSLTRKQLTEQLKCYLDLMHNVPYSRDLITPIVTVNELINQALKTKKFEIKKNTTDDDIIILSRKKLLLMAYYKNNIVHMLILPSLITALIIQYRCLRRQELIFYIKILYPMLKAEFFLRWKSDDLILVLNKLINELLRQKIIIIKENKLLTNPYRAYTAQLLASSIYVILQRYTIIFWLLNENPFISRSSLEKESFNLSKRLAILYNINIPEFFDKVAFSTLASVLRNEGYMNDITNLNLKRIINTYQILLRLVDSNFQFMIKSAKDLMTTKKSV